MPVGAPVAPSSPESRGAVVETAMKPETATTVSPEAQKLLNFAKEEKAKNGNPETVLSQMQEQVKPIDAHAVKAANEKYIPPSGVDTKGKPKPTPEEDARRKMAEQWGNINNTVLEKGYDGLTPADKDNVHTAIESYIKNSGIPEMAAVWGGNRAEQDAMLKAWMENPAMRKSVQKLFEGALNPKDLIDAQAIRDAQKEVRQRDHDVRRLTQERKVVEEQLHQAQALSDSFKPGGASETDLAGLVKTQDTDLSTYTSEQANIARCSELLKAQAARDGIPVGKNGEVSPGAVKLLGDRDAERAKQLTDLSNQLKIAHENAAKAKVRIDRKVALEAQKQAAKNDVLKLGAALNIKDEELRHANAELFVAKGLLNENTLAQETFVNGVKNVIPEAAREFLITQIQKREEQEKARLTNEKEKSDEAVVKGILDKLENRYDNEPPEGFWDSLRRPDLKGKIREKWSAKYNHKSIKDDYGILKKKDGGTLIDSSGNVMKLSGAELLMKDYLVKCGVVIDDDIKQWLNNKEFMDKYMPQVIEKLLAKKIAINGEKSIKNKDAKSIMQTEWGRKAIGESLKKGGNSQEAAVIEELAKNGKLTPEELKKRGLSFKQILLLAIIGAVYTGVKTGQELSK